MARLGLGVLAATAGLATASVVAGDGIQAAWAQITTTLPRVSTSMSVPQTTVSATVSTPVASTAATVTTPAVSATVQQSPTTTAVSASASTPATTTSATVSASPPAPAAPAAPAPAAPAPTPGQTQSPAPAASDSGASGPTKAASQGSSSEGATPAAAASASSPAPADGSAPAAASSQPQQSAARGGLASVPARAGFSSAAIQLEAERRARERAARRAARGGTADRADGAPISLAAARAAVVTPGAPSPPWKAWEDFVASLALPPLADDGGFGTSSAFTRLGDALEDGGWAIPVAPVVAAFALLFLLYVWLLNSASARQHRLAAPARLLASSPQAAIAVVASVTALLCAAFVLLATL